MKDLRLWAIILSGAWFLAGLSAGVLLSRSKEAPGPFASYAESLADEFSLTPKARRVLAQVLDQYESDREAIRRRHEANTRGVMEPDLRALDTATQKTIRDRIVPPRAPARARFDELTKPRTLTASID